MGFQGWFQVWSQGSRVAKALDPWDRPGTRTNPSIFSNRLKFVSISLSESLCHARCFPSFPKIFPQGKNIYFETPSQGSPGVREMGDETESLLPDPNYNMLDHIRCELIAKWVSGETPGGIFTYPRREQKVLFLEENKQ